MRSRGKSGAPSRLAPRILALLGAPHATLDVIALSDREIAALKRQFIKKPGEPNVLAFPEPPHFPHPETKRRVLGEVYLNRDILRKHPERTAPLLLHGILHLMGHDHEKASDAARMERLERRVLGKL